MDLVQIRGARPEDAVLLADLSRRTFYETFAEQNSKENMDKFLGVQMTDERVKGELLSTHSHFLLAEKGSQCLGYAMLKESPPPQGLPSGASVEISRIYVVKNAVGQGVGESLMEACLAEARAKKCDWIWLGVWEHNQRAIAFYVKWGFEKFGSHSFLLGDDLQTDWLMKKRLTPMDPIA